MTNASAVPPTSRPEKAAALLGLLVMTGAFARIGAAGSTGDNAGAFSTTAQLAFGAWALLRLLSPHARTSGRRMALDPWLVALLVVAVVSLTQSVAPGLGVRRIAAAVTFTVFGLYLADRFQLREQLMLVTLALGIAAVACVVVVVVAPSYGLMPNGDAAWRGVFDQKNVLARSMALGCVAATYTLAGPRPRRAALGVVGLLGVMIAALASARSALAPVAVLLALTPLTARAVTKVRSPARGAVLATLGAVLVGGWLVVSAAGGVFAVFGKDPSLNGRAPLWSSVVDAIGQHPWFGYGYGTFWRGWLPPSTMVTLENVWGPPHAHNGLLDMVLGVGVVGAAVWLVVIARGFLAASRAATHDTSNAVMWPLGYLVLLVVYNVFEVTTTSNAMFWSLFVAVTTTSRGALVRPATSSVRRRRPSLAAPSSAR